MAIEYSFSVSENNFLLGDVVSQLKEAGCIANNIEELQSGFIIKSCYEELGFLVSLINISESIFPYEILELDKEFYVRQTIGFRMNKEYNFDTSKKNLISVIRKLLVSKKIDVLFTLNGEWIFFQEKGIVFLNEGIDFLSENDFKIFFNIDKITTIKRG